MKRIITLIFVVLFAAISINSNAQCTPNTSQNAFLIPDTATDLAPAFTYMPYDEVIYIAVPSDTTVYSLPTTIDSVVITGITGLPPSISFAVTPGSAVIHGGGFGCIQFTGTPTNAEIGTYPLVINSLISANIMLVGDTTIPIPLQGYSLKVLDSASFGIYHPDNHYEFSVFQNTPNPFNSLTEIAFLSPGKEKINIEVYDITGNMVFSKDLVSVQGYNSVIFDGTKLPSGVYIYKVSNGQLTVSKRMSLTKN